MDFHYSSQQFWDFFREMFTPLEAPQATHQTLNALPSTTLLLNLEEMGHSLIQGEISWCTVGSFVRDFWDIMSYPFFWDDLGLHAAAVSAVSALKTTGLEYNETSVLVGFGSFSRFNESLQLERNLTPKLSDWELATENTKLPKIQSVAAQEISRHSCSIRHDPSHLRLHLRLHSQFRQHLSSENPKETIEKRGQIPTSCSCFTDASKLSKSWQLPDLISFFWIIPFIL